MTDSLKVEFSAVQSDEEGVISETSVVVNYPRISNASANAINLGMTRNVVNGALDVADGMASAKASE